MFGKKESIFTLKKSAHNRRIHLNDLSLIYSKGNEKRKLNRLNNTPAPSKNRYDYFQAI